jgi:hypothetical protein
MRTSALDRGLFVTAFRLCGRCPAQVLTAKRHHGTVATGFSAIQGPKGALGACQPESLVSRLHWR